MPDYQRGKVYQIKGGDECYIGSTTVELVERFYGHKHNYKHEDRRSTSSCILFEKYGVEKCSIELIELVQCDNKKDLLARELYWIENTVCVNKLKPNLTVERRKAYRHITNKAYRELHKDELDKRSAQYRKDNVERIEQKQSEKMVCECGKMVRRDYLKKHKKRCGSTPQQPTTEIFS